MGSLNNSYRIELAKSFTELAIQNGLFSQHTDPKSTAIQITDFFKTVSETTVIADTSVTKQ